MNDFARWPADDLRQLLTDLEADYAAMDIFATPELTALEERMEAIQEELCQRELAAMEDDGTAF